MKRVILFLLICLIPLALSGDEVIIDGYEAQTTEVQEFDGLISAPSVSPANKARIFYNMTADELRLSENGGSYRHILSNPLDEDETLAWSPAATPDETLHWDSIIHDFRLSDDLYLEDNHPGLVLSNTDSATGYALHFHYGTAYPFGLWYGAIDGYGAFVGGGYPLMYADDTDVGFPKGNVMLNNSAYLNFGLTSGSSGHGIRDNSGTMQYKSVGGSWTDIGTGGGGATAWDDITAPDANDEIDFASYITELNVEDFRIGDGGTSYVGFSGNGDIDLHDDSPHLFFYDTDTTTGYMWHLDESAAAAPWQGLTLWDVSDNAGTIVDSYPELFLDTSNNFSVDTKDNTFYVDAVNNRIGIGTVSPAVPLHLYSSADGVSNTVFETEWVSPTPADDDATYIDHKMADDAGNSVEYVRRTIKATDVSDGSEDGEYEIQVVKNGSLIDALSIRFNQVVLNETGADVNLRVEGDTDTYLLFGDAGLDTVTVGSATSLGKLGIDGDQDEIQLVVQGNATQNTNLAVFENSGGTDQVTISNAGIITANGLTVGDDEFLTLGSATLEDDSTLNDVILTEDLRLSDTSPHLELYDSSDTSSYQFHYDAEATYPFALWYSSDGTNYGGSPLMYSDDSYMYFPKGIATKLAESSLKVYDSKNSRMTLQPTIQIWHGPLVLASAWDEDAEWPLMWLHEDRYPSGIVITKWYVQCNVASPSTNLAADLKYCNDNGTAAFPGDSPVLIDVLDTSVGNSSETDMSNSDLGSGIIPTGKKVYISMDSDPADADTYYELTIIGYIPQ